MIKKILFATIALMLLTSPAFTETSVMLITDPHYLSAELFDRDSPYFTGILSGMDGRLTQYGPELMDALAQEVRHRRPDALIITGDLSYNGEKKSHEELAARLREIGLEGTPVYVIPGNHDINTIRPVAFASDHVYTTEDVDIKEFTDIYRDLMLPAEGGPGANLSYHVRLSGQMWLAMTDVACYEGIAYTNGIFTDAHEAWLRTVLSEAAEAGSKVVTASHHSLIAHSEYEKKYYLMAGDDPMRALKAEFGSKLHLSGHLHVQHIAEKDGIVDAATGAFCLFPHYYAMIRLEDDGALTYEVSPLCAEHLPEGFSEMSRKWFTDIAAAKSLRSLMGSDISPEDMKLMAEFSARFNLGYFSGDLTGSDEWLQEKAFRLWEAQRGTFADYIRTVITEAGGSHLSVRVE